MPRGAVAALLLVAGACVQDPVPVQPPMCTKSSECQPGQTCHGGMCFTGTGGDFAAELFAPAGRTDMLYRGEVDPLTIEQGKLSVMFGKSVFIKGRVLLTSDKNMPSVAAKVSFRRPSRIPGAQDFVVVVDAAAGKLLNEIGYSVRLPPNQPGESYEVTVLPDDGSLSPPGPGQLPANALCPPVTNLPPLRWEADPPQPQDISCDFGGLYAISGTVVDSDGHGMQGMVVRAYTPSGIGPTQQLVSSTATTDGAGAYTLYVPLSRAGNFDLKITPGVHMIAPTLLRHPVHPTKTGNAYVVDPVVFPRLPGFAPYSLPVTTSDQTPVAGAQVHLLALLATTDTDTVSYETDTITGTDGVATPTLAAGTADTVRQYTADILTLQGSVAQSVWNKTVPVGASAGLSPLILGTRIPVSGRVVDVNGAGVASLGVQPQINPTWLATLTSDQQASLAQLSLPQAMTSADGTFSVFLDPTLVGMAAVYDLELVPASSSTLPRWSQDGVAIPANATSVDLSRIPLPASSLATGTVTDENGAPVQDAELRVYTLTDDSSRLRTIAKSGKDGGVTMYLPSP